MRRIVVGVDGSDHARRALEFAIDEAEAHGGRVEAVMVIPGRTLLGIAEGADLLVVGSRGLGGFRGLLLGSVSQQCATHAPCPIAVVPGERNR